MDREQTEKLYEAHYMRVFSYAMTLSGDRELNIFPGFLKSRRIPAGIG